MASKQRCPKCNYPNELGAAQCANCRAPLLTVCPRCGAARPWYVPRCARCESTAPDEAIFADLFRQAPTERLHGRYLIQETLASGRVSAVYKGMDGQNAGAFVAIKELTTTALFRPQEQRDAEAALRGALDRWGRVQHPALPKLVEWFNARGKYYVVFDYVEGWSLRRVLTERRWRIGGDLARNWGAQLARLGQALHRQDPPLYMPFLSPGHVVVTPGGEVKLVDWGLTHIFAPSAYGPYGAVAGYTAPELATSFPTPQTDVFALGRLLYALLAGQLLEKGLGAAMPLRQAAPGLSDQLVKAIARAAHRDPAQRYGSLAELADALWDAMYGELAPMTDWTQTALVAPAAEPAAATRYVAPLQAAPPRPIASLPNPAEPGNMAEMGFRRDPRFGPRPDDTHLGSRQTAPAPASLGERQAAPAPQGAPKLSVHPRELDLSDAPAQEVKRVVLTVRNSGDAELVGQVLSHVGWISAPHKVFKVPAGKQAQVLLAVRGALIPSGRTAEPQALSVETNAGRQWVSAMAEVVAGPALKVEQALLDFGSFESDAERSLPLTVTNAGRQPLAGNVTARAAWLRVPKGDFKLAAGRSAQIGVQIAQERLPRGRQSADGAVLVDSDGGQARVAAQAWRVAPELDLGASHMDFGSAAAGDLVERVLMIGNTGDAPLSGAARPLTPWLQAQPREFVCAPGDMVEVALTADTVGLADGALEIPQALRVQTNGGGRTLSLRLVVRAPKLALGANRLDFGVIPLGDSRSLRVAIRNDGSAPLVAALQSLAEWLRIEPLELRVDPKQELFAVATAETASFPQGCIVALPAALRVVSGATVIELPATLTALQPALHVEPTTLDFGYVDRARPEQRELVIANEGTGKLAWNAQTDALWVEAAPSAGVCAAGERQVVTLTAYGLALEAEATGAESALIINSDGGRAKLPLRVAIAAPELATDTTWLDLGESVNRGPAGGAFRIFNRGLGRLFGALRAGQTWLALDRVSFECPTGQSVEVRVSVDPELLGRDAGRYTGQITVASNGGNAEIEATLMARYAPRLEAEISRLERPDPAAPAEGRLTLRNVGLAPARAELRSCDPQLTLGRDAVDIKPGKSARVALRWDGPAPAPGVAPAIEILAGEQRLRVGVIL